MLRMVALTDEEASRIAGLLRLGGGPRGSELADKIMDTERTNSVTRKVETKKEK